MARIRLVSIATDQANACVARHCRRALGNAFMTKEQRAEAQAAWIEYVKSRIRY